MRILVSAGKEAKDAGVVVAGVEGGVGVCQVVCGSQLRNRGAGVAT